MSTAKKKVIVSGIQPSGKLHVGNYAGAVRNWLDLQDSDEYDCYFFIADYHSISEDYDPAEKRRQIMDLALDLLACGIDPEKCTFFAQSAVIEHTELCWIFNTVTPVSFLERMTQFKDKAARQAANVNAGIFDYPVLQAADILMYKGAFVPVGQDQIQHVELTRDIARFYNNKFGAYFPETKPKITDTPKLLSLTDPLRKMSKSLGEKSYVALTDEPAAIENKLKRAVTETTGVLPFDSAEFLNGNIFELVEKAAGRTEEEKKGYAGVWNLLTMLRLFGQPHEADRVFAGQPIKYGDLKKLVAQRIGEYFAPFREKRAALAKDPENVRRMLDRGAEKATAVAKRTMTDVRKAIGLR